jgi:nucleotide-binding universal stress UspA family protein
MRNILVQAANDTAMDARLETGLAVARALDAHLSLLHVTPVDAYVVMDPFGGSFLMADAVAKLHAEAKALEAKLTTKLTAEAVRWDWRAIDGPVGPAFSNPRQLADLIILSIGETGFDRAPVGDIVLSGDTPVLVTPANLTSFDPFGPAVVAWNGSREAANALRAAVPLLRCASAVTIISVGSDPANAPAEDAAAYLSRAGIKPEIALIAREGDVAETMRRALIHHDAELLVMGAYGKSRLREAVFGGVTASFIASTPVPILMAH